VADIILVILSALSILGSTRTSMEYRRLPLRPHGVMLQYVSFDFLTPGLNFVVHTVYYELIFNRICSLMGSPLKLRCISVCLSVNIIRFDSRLTYFYKTLCHRVLLNLWPLSCFC